MQLLDMPEPPHSLVYYFALLADLCSVERIQPSVRRLSVCRRRFHAAVADLGVVPPIDWTSVPHRLQAHRRHRR